MWIFCLIFWLLKVTSGVDEVISTKQTSKGCHQQGPFFSEDFVCIKTSQTEHVTGTRLGDGTTCWHKKEPSAYGLKCADGVWKRISGLRRKKRTWFWSCPDDMYITAEQGRACANSASRANSEVRCFSSDTVMHYTQGFPHIDCNYIIHVTVHHCSSVPYIRHGNIHCSGADASAIWGSVCTISCDNGYYRLGASTTECIVSSNVARWSNTFPTCAAYLCPSLPTFSNGSRSCYGGDSDIAYGSRCNHTCNEGYRLNGTSSVQCLMASTSAQWGTVFPFCERICSWPRDHCWPGDCSNQLTSNCVCRPSFSFRQIENGARCELTIEPDLSSCELSVFDEQNVETMSRSSGNVTSCQNQRNEWIRTQPHSIKFALKASLNIDVGNYSHYINESKVGITGAEIVILTTDNRGSIRQVGLKVLNTTEFCQQNVSATSPLIGEDQLDCKGTIPLEHINLADGDSLCVDMKAYAGGYYKVQDNNQRLQSLVTFQPVSKIKRVCFMLDSMKPVHNLGISSEPLTLYYRTTRIPKVDVQVSGWIDNTPSGRSSSSASQVEKFTLEIHGVNDNVNTSVVQSEPISNYTIDWSATETNSNGIYYYNILLPDENPRLYALILAVHDYAGNVGYARRLILYDNSSSVQLDELKHITVTSAYLRSNVLWHTDLSKAICVDWRERFYNSWMVTNNLLMPVSVDTTLQIYDRYDQIDGLLPISGTDNVKGIVQFELSWSRDGSQESQLKNILPVQAQTSCINETLKDGETYDIRIIATDIMGNSKDDTVQVDIDSTAPEINIRGLRGRFGHDGLLVHNTTDLSKMVLVVEIMDLHSGIDIRYWTLKTADNLDLIGSEHFGANPMPNDTTCNRTKMCYCPSIGPCENFLYTLRFDRLQVIMNETGLHHRHYLITVTASNKAGLSASEDLNIFIDESPPSVGVVLEGQEDTDEAEMDFTSNPIVHIRWNGFQDHESGIVQYRIMLDSYCKNAEQMDTDERAVVVDREDSVSLQVSEEGHYIASVIAYNGALEPSEVVCSDGFTYDTSPPSLVNVSIVHARIGRTLGCVDVNQTWLINANLTRTRLASTMLCSNTCASREQHVNIEHFPATSNHSLDEDVSNDLCQRLQLINGESLIVLPSDYLRLVWAAVDHESDMEEYFVGIGQDKTSEVAPDLLPFTRTHGRSLYHHRHTGLGHGTRFYIFLQALSKAGLYANLVLGPFMIDVTPPDVTEQLMPFVDASFLVVVWGDTTFRDTEQPTGVDFDITFRIGHEEAYVTPFLSLSESSIARCVNNTVTGCVRFPLSALWAQDTERGRNFFFQLHISNAAGHVTSVNTSSIKLPPHLPPTHVVVIDVIKSLSVYAETIPSTAIINPTQDFYNFTTSSRTLSPFQTHSALPRIDITDADTVLRAEEVCIVWSEFYHEDTITVQVGIGTSQHNADLVQFSDAKGHMACVNATHFPDYTKMFSLVKATNPGGNVVLSSDGFYFIPANDSRNRLMVFNGKGCRPSDVIATHLITLVHPAIDLNLTTEIQIHPGDILFIHLQPFIPNVTFVNALLLQTTLTGYQIVVTSSRLTLTLPPNTITGATVQIAHCLKDAAMLTHSLDRVSITWEFLGPWTDKVTSLKVKLLDDTCITKSSKKEKHVIGMCQVAEKHVSPRNGRLNFPEVSLMTGHAYITFASACFNDDCLPGVLSNVLLFDETPHTILIESATLFEQYSDYIMIEVNATIQSPFFDSLSNHGWMIVYKWTVSRDQFATFLLYDWKVEMTNVTNSIKTTSGFISNGFNRGSLYACVQLLYPIQQDYPTCHEVIRRTVLNEASSLHLIEILDTVFREMNFEAYLHSQHLGSKLHELYDLDLDFATSDDILSAIVTDGDERNITWFLMTSSRTPLESTCIEDSACLSEKTTSNGKVIFSVESFKLQNGHEYFVCASVSERVNNDRDEQSGSTYELCGDGVVIDDTPPVEGEVIIANSDSGYLTDNERVLVTWVGFSDVETEIDHLFVDMTLNYSVALGSYPGSEDIARFIQVGSRTAWAFQHLNITPGTNCIATVKAQDRVGHVTQVWSKTVIIDNTPPSGGRVVVGEITQEMFVAGSNVPVQWESVEDNESGISSVELAINSLSENDDGIMYQSFHGNAGILTASSMHSDGHSYIVLLRATNGAGLTMSTTSEPFIIDNSPPDMGNVWNSASNSSIHTSFSTDCGTYNTYWTGFSDPHSGLAYFQVGLGSQPYMTDVQPLVFVGLTSSYKWQLQFQQGRKYFTTVQACNRAGLCRLASSSSLTFDNSPPTTGVVTVGFDGHHSKFLGHTSSLPVQWTGIYDPQTGIEEFFWCVGLEPGNCSITSFQPTLLSRSTVRADITLLQGVKLYVTVRARNPVGLESISTSDCFIVDPTPPEVIMVPHFLSLRDGGVINSQWDRSGLRIAWKFNDSESSVVSSTVNIRSQMSGRLVTDAIKIAAEDELTIVLDDKHLLVNGDFYWVAVTACNAAALCTTSSSSLLLVDSTPPVVGTFENLLSWKQNAVAQSGYISTTVNVTWLKFSDAESGIAGYFITAGRKYNGEELSGGQVKVPHSNASHIQNLTLTINERLCAGDVIYLSIWAENFLGLQSGIARMAFDVIQDNSNSITGSLISIHHSCDIAYCTKDCTCGAFGKCSVNDSQCRILEPTDSRLGGLAVYLHIGTATKKQKFTTSQKCLEGHWHLSDAMYIANVSRFEWMFRHSGNVSERDILSVSGDWHDVGRKFHAVHCMPGNQMLEHTLSYVLQVRTWLSGNDHVNFTSDPVTVDRTPPAIRQGKIIKDSDFTCTLDLDYVTSTPTITSCWNGVFYDAESNVTLYEVWVGTSRYADDYIKKTNIGLNTSFILSTSGFEESTHYYVTVRAWNGAGLLTTAVSDGVTLDLTPPRSGVVFAAKQNSVRHAQSSTTSLTASWHGFEDKHSGVVSYVLSVYDADDATIPLVPFHDVGFETELDLEGLSLIHKHSYKIVVKARDAAGWESSTVESAPLLVDTTPPEGIICNTFRLQESKELDSMPSRSLLQSNYATKFAVDFAELNEPLKIVIQVYNVKPGVNGHIGINEVNMPVYFKYGKLDNATAEHVFLLPFAGNTTLDIAVGCSSGANVTANLYRCLQTESSSDKAVTIQQLSQDIISICAHVHDSESGIKSMLIGVGTTEGGLQVQPFISVGYSGHIAHKVNVQHGSPLFATILAENHAGIWARFISQPIYMDRSAPIISEIAVTVKYGNGSEMDETKVIVEAEWNSTDSESGVETCTCKLESGQQNGGDVVQSSIDVTRGRCQWKLTRPQHGATVFVIVSCVNRVQLHRSRRSSPIMILLLPPDVSDASVAFLPNSKFMSPFDWSDSEIRSSNSTLEFCWYGFHDSTISEFQYRLLHMSRPLMDWIPVNPYKTSAILNGSLQTLTGGELTAQVQALNTRMMASETVMTTVRLDNSRPSLSGKPATFNLENEQLNLDWREVFSVNHDVTYSVFAGTALGFSDVIMNVVSKTTSLQLVWTKPLSEIYVIIKAVYPNGLTETYQSKLV